MKQLRQTILADADLIASKRRFGLFSQPPPLGLGDDSKFKQKNAKKGQDGKPVTQPRNILAGPVLSGVSKKSFIQVPQSIYQKDPYKNTYQVELKYHNSMHKKSPIHQSQFRPASGFKTLANAPSKYVQQKQQKIKKIKRDQNGRVKTQPANFSTNPTSKVQTTFFKQAKHMPDPYSRKQQMEKQQKLFEKKKIIHQTTFKSMSYGDRNFGKDKVQYGVDQKVKDLIKNKKSFSYQGAKKVIHQAKFKLACKATGDLIGRYPQFILPKGRVHTEGSQSTKLKTQPANKQDVELWKPSSGNLSRPTPSISLMNKNMRRYM